MAGERTLPGLGLTGYWTLGDNTYKAGLDANLRLLSLLVQAHILSIRATAPGAPADGQVYIASSIWGGASINDLVIRDNGSWVPFTPEPGWVVFNRETKQNLQFDGTSWIVLKDSKYLGTFVSLVALESAHATALPGEFADVDEGVGSAVVRYVWDDSDSEWVGGTSGSEVTVDKITDANTNRNLSDGDLVGNRIIFMTNNSNPTVTITNTVTGTEPVTIINKGTGNLHFVSSGGVTLNSAEGHTYITTRHRAVTVIPEGSGVYTLIGAEADPA